MGAENAHAFTKPTNVECSCKFLGLCNEAMDGLYSRNAQAWPGEIINCFQKEKKVWGKTLMMN